MTQSETVKYHEQSKTSIVFNTLLASFKVTLHWKKILHKLRFLTIICVVKHIFSLAIFDKHLSEIKYPHDTDDNNK